jgi:hypothetical protein
MTKSIFSTLHRDRTGSRSIGTQHILKARSFGNSFHRFFFTGIEVSVKLDKNICCPRSMSVNGRQTVVHFVCLLRSTNWYVSICVSCVHMRVPTALCCNLESIFTLKVTHTSIRRELHRDRSGEPHILSLTHSKTHAF